MSAAGLKGLLKAAFNDPALETRLTAEAGYTITAEEFSQALEGWEEWRISSIHDVET